MTFDACNKRVCTKVDIKDDCFVEDSESFKIKVEVVKTKNVHKELLIEPSQRSITIEDTDGIEILLLIFKHRPVYVCMYNYVWQSCIL